MKAILSDNDVEGHFAALVEIWESDEWLEFWMSLNIRIQTFETLGLSRHVPDSEIWTLCQSEQVVLVTGNRNDDGPDSLESTIRRHNDVKCLPVFTLANPNRILLDREYAARAAELLLDYLLRIDEFRGCGRVFVP